MLNVKSNARKPAGLTIMRATSRARRVVDAVMPAADATVDSRKSYDLQRDEAVIITTVTFPRGHAAADELARALGEFGRIEVFNTRIVITRAV